MRTAPFLLAPSFLAPRHIAARLLTPLALLTLAALTPQLAAQGQGKALKRFRVAYKLDKTHKVAEQKRTALQALAKFDSAKAATAMIDGYAALEREAEPIRERRAKFLFRGGGSKLLRPLRAKLQPVRDLQDEIVAALEDMSSQEAVHAMFHAMLRRQGKLPLTLQLAIAERTADLDERQIDALFADAERATNAGKVAVLLRAIAPLGRRAERAAGWVIAQLEHKNPDVRAEAATALASLCRPESLEPLVAHLEHATAKVREHILDTLVILTGVHPGNTTSAWKLWLSREGAAFLSGEERLGRGKASQRNKGGHDGATESTYFGIPQTGDAILYVFDNSLSMRNRMGKRRTSSKEDGTDNRPTRWDRCREELHRALNGLTSRQSFNLIGFANQLRLFEETMQPVTPKNIERAHAWIDGIELEFETNSHDALERAFHMAGRGSKDRYYATEVDTVFFLSDGAPTMPNEERGRGIKADVPEQILSAVRRWNALSRVAVHTIGLGIRKNAGGRKGRGNAKGRGGRGARREPGAAHDFMQQLAKQNAGKFVLP